MNRLRGFLAFVLALAAGAASAQTCEHGTTTEYSLGFYYSSGEYSNASPQWFASAISACTAMAVRMSAPGNADVAVSGSLLCSVTWNSGAFGDARTVATRSACAPPPAVDCGQLARESAAFRTGPLNTACPLRVVVGECVLMASGSGRDEGNTESRFWGPFRVASGQDGACATGTTPASQGPSTLAPGRCPGTVNGTEVPGGVPCGSTTQSGPETAAGTPAGAASAPPGIVPGQSTTQVTTCTNGSCTTVTNIYSGGNGSVGSGTLTGTATETQPQNDYCQKNPSAPQCKNEEGSFGGSCAGGFTCDGDAVQCAIAKDQHARNCAFFDAETPQRTTFENAVAAGTSAAAAIAGSESSAFAFPSAANTTAVGPESGCIGDKSVSIMGHTASIPLSQMCGSAGIVGNALVLLATLIGAFICFRPKAA